MALCKMGCTDDTVYIFRMDAIDGDEFYFDVVRVIEHKTLYYEALRLAI